MQNTHFIEAKPGKLAKWFWQLYFTIVLKRWFSRCMVSGLAEVEQLRRTMPENIPWIFYCTHSSWWDAALCIVLSNRVMKIDAYGMMEFKQLVKYKFFRRIGMFSIVRNNPRSAMKSLAYIAKKLRDTNQALWIFPQGVLVHQDCRPIVCEPGIEILARRLEEVVMCPVAIRYDMVREQRATCLVRFGTPELVQRGYGSMNTYEERLTSLAAEAQQHSFAEDYSEYTTFLYGGKSMEKRFDSLTRKS